MALRTPAAALLLAALAFSLAGCGRIGPIKPPLVLIPQRVDNLQARQFGGEIVLTWSLPTAFIDGRALGPISEVEIWLETRPVAPASEEEPAAIDPEEFKDKARLEEAVPAARLVPRTTGPDALRPVVFYRRPISEKEYAKLEYVFAVRVREARRKTLSEFSNAAAVSPQPAPVPPANPRATVFQDRIEILWDPPTENFDKSVPVKIGGYNVYELGGDGSARKITDAPVPGPPFADREFVFGQAAKYMIRAATEPAAGALESADSSAVEVVPVDKFAPTVPAGLTAVSGADYITLIWDPNREPDLLGYRIWRRPAGTGEFAPLNPAPLLENTITDKAVEPGRRYEYAVSAVDQAKNESARSASVFEAVKEKS